MDYNGSEYILKPRLSCFDLGRAGAITGQISTGATFTRAPHFVIKAEELSADGTYHMVHRYTVPDSSPGFIASAGSAPTATTTYDVLIRGIGYQTTIVKSVPVTRGTTSTFNLAQSTDHYLDNRHGLCFECNDNFYEVLGRLPSDPACSRRGAV